MLFLEKGRGKGKVETTGFTAEARYRTSCALAEPATGSAGVEHRRGCILYFNVLNLCNASDFRCTKLWAAGYACSVMWIHY